jgi:hypothetical protein
MNYYRARPASHLERGHEGLLLVGGVRGILVVGEVVRPIVIDLVEHLGAGRPAWGLLAWRTSACATRATALAERPAAAEAEAVASSCSSAQSSPRSWAAPRAASRTACCSSSASWAAAYAAVSSASYASRAYAYTACFGK